VRKLVAEKFCLQMLSLVMNLIAHCQDKADLGPSSYTTFPLQNHRRYLLTEIRSVTLYKEEGKPYKTIRKRYSQLK